MASNPTIIAASLNDEELRKSINKLVNHVDDQLHYMVASTKVNVKSINDALEKIGDVDTKLGSKGSKSGGTSKQVEAQEELGKSVDKTTSKIKKQGEVSEMTFDQMRSSIEKAIRVPSEMRMPDMAKSARESFIAFQHGYKEQAQQIFQSITKAENALNDVVARRIERLKQQLEETKRKLNELYSVRTIQESYEGSGLRTNTRKLDTQIERQLLRIKELEEQIAAASNGMVSPEMSARLGALRAEYARISNIMKESRQQSTSATQQQLSAEQKLTDEIHKQAQAIRESKQWKEKGFVTVNGRDIYNFEGSDTPLKNRVTLEEQLLRLQELEKSTSKEITEEGAKRLTQEQLELAITGSTKETLQKSRDILRAMVETRQATSTFTAQLESANRLNEKLKELRTRYNEMTFGQRMSAEGQEIAKNIRIVTRETQKLQSQLSRPANLKEALGHPEKTLDDIAYKIQQLRAYMRGLDTTNARSASEVRTVTYALEELKKKENDLLGKQAQLFGSNNALARSWNYMKNRLAFYFTVGASTSFIRNLIEVRSQYEMNERALGILINSAERGTKIFNELSQMALVSPYTLIELSAAAKQLTAYDIAAKDVVDTTRRLADMAAAVGVPIERLTYALGQIKAYGYLNSRDNRMFANAGIPLVKQLADYYTELEGRLVTTADVYDRIKKKSVSYEDTMQVINRMTDEGGKFFDFQAKLAETLKVQLANLTLAWNNMLNDIGKESQGILVGGIGTLKQMFLHWKDIEHVLYEIIIAFGAYKAAQMASIAMTGTFTKTLDANILAMKRAEATSLQRAALTRTLTAGEMRLIAAQNSVTASDYRMMLSSKSLTKQQALLMVALNRRNTALAQALIRMGLLTASEIRSMTAGKALSLVWKSMAISIKSAAAAMGSFMVSNWWLLAIGGIYEILHAWDSYDEHVAEVNRSAAEHAKESLKSIREYLDSDATRQALSGASKGTLTNAEASKAWDVMRDKIEEVSAASNSFVAQLLDINDISERLTLGAQYLQDIENARKAISEMDEDAITLSQTVAGGLLGEGLKDDLKQYEEAIDKYANLEKTFIENSTKGWNKYTTERENQMQEFVSEVKKTTDDIYNVASSRGLNANAQREFFEVAISERAQKEQLSVRGTRLLRMKAEEEYFKFAKSKLEERMQYEQGARRARTQQELKDLESQFGTQKAMQESFFDWLSDKHSSEVTRRLGHLTAEEIKTGTWLNGENLKWAKERAQDFAREYGLSFNTLYGYVKEANTWEIHIKTFFDTIGQPLTDVQADYESRTGKKFKDNPVIKDATTQLDIIKKLQDEEAKLTEEYNAAKKAGGGFFVTNHVRMEGELEDLRNQIHAYNALTKAEEQAQKDKNKNKGGSKKDILGDALAKEVQLIGEIQKRYKEYQQMGVNAQEAVTLATEEYGNTLRRTNATLAKYGIATKSSDELAGMDIREIRDYYKTLLEGAKNKDNAKGIEAIEKALANINVEITKLDYKKITDGLNNELGKLKEEYELAVELDADPEMGNLFAEMFRIDTSDFPHTIDEYMDAVQQKFEDAVDERGFMGYLGRTNNVFKASEEDWKLWAEQVGLSEEALKNFNGKFIEAQGVARKWAQDTVKSIRDLEYKLGDINKKIEIENTKLKVLEEQAANETNVNLKHLLELRIQEQKEAIEKLKMESIQLLPFYEDLFGDMYNVSVRRLKDIANAAKEVMRPQKDGQGVGYVQRKNEKGKTVYDIFAKDREGNIKKTTVSLQEFIKINKQIDSVQQKIAESSPWEKIKDSFSKDANGKIKNIASGIEGISGELGKMGQLTGVVTEIFSSFSNPNEYNETAEVMGDIGTSMEGLAQAGQGFAKIYSGDIIGGATDMVKGFYSAISTWFDNSDKKILQQIKDSEREVQKLEITVESLKGSYDAMTDSAEHSYGAQSAAATLAASSMKEQEIALKRLMLAETKRQLRLEQSRSSKNRDDDKILSLQKDIISQQNEIDSMLRETSRAVDEVVDSLLGISRASWAEELTDALISAFKAGEDYMDVFEDSWEEMVQNMVVKTIAAKVIGDALEKNVLSKIEEIENQKTADERQQISNLEQHKTNLKNLRLKDESAWFDTVSSYNQFGEIINRIGGGAVEAYKNYLESFKDTEEVYREAISEGLGYKKAMELVAQATINKREARSKLMAYSDQIEEKFFELYGEYGVSLNNSLKQAQEEAQIEALKQVLTGPSGAANKEALMQSVSNVLPDMMKTWGIQFGQDATKELSALQRGIQGITEDTAGAIEGYMNGVSQQVYLHSTILTQIRDAVVAMNGDIQLSVQGQMLLQLQQSYQVQMSIESILQGVLVPSGRAFAVELMS